MTRNTWSHDHAAHPAFNISILPGGTMPFRALPLGAENHIPSCAVGYDILTRAIVELEMDPENPLMRKTIYDFEDTPQSPQFQHINVLDKKFILYPGEIAYLGTGVVIEMPDNVAGWVKPRGSTIIKGLAILNSDVPIDPDFRGEPIIVIRNEQSVKAIDISNHERLAQFVFTPVVLPILREVPIFEETLRGNGSHGSTVR